jgi:capsular polysaccharide transport system permease protein
MSTLMGAIGRTPPKGESFTLFYATGYLAFSMYATMVSYVTQSISANKNLLQYPIVAPFDAVVARMLLQAATSAIVASVIIAGALYTVRHASPISWPQVMESTILAWLLALGVALLNIVLFNKMPLYEKVFKIITRPLFLLSGVLYSVVDMPTVMRDVLLWNPLTHVVILFREGFYGGVGADGLDLPFAIESAVIAFGLGMVMFTVIPIARVRD